MSLNDLLGILQRNWLLLLTAAISVGYVISQYKPELFRGLFRWKKHGSELKSVEVGVESDGECETEGEFMSSLLPEETKACGEKGDLPLDTNCLITEIEEDFVHQTAVLKKQHNQLLKKEYEIKEKVMSYKEPLEKVVAERKKLAHLIDLRERFNKVAIQLENVRKNPD